MEYKNYSLEQASNEVINNKLTKLGGTGGIIAIDKDGNVAMPFNTEGMYRGYLINGSASIVKIYKD
jgi:beta-aspartyl-peptidase (threonine type)